MTVSLTGRRPLAGALLVMAILTGLLGPASAADASFDGSLDATAAAPAAFVDVAETAFYSDSVAWARATGVTTGTSPSTFSPNQPVPRWQMALFLRRFADWLNANTSTAAHGFVDVGHLSADAQAAIGWLKSTGITTGTGPTTFGPDQPVTRAQMAAFLRRFADWADLAPSPGPDAFVDTASQSVEFRRAIGWLQATGITTGTTATTFDPGGSVSRGQMVTFLRRLALTTRRAATASLLVSPRDIEGVRCYVDDDLEMNRPPAFIYPLEDAAQQASNELDLAQSEVAAAQDALDAAEEAAQPTFAPQFVVDGDVPERLEALATYTSLLAANKLVQELWAAVLVRQIASMEEFLAKPGLTFGNLFTEAGEEEWIEYLDKRYWDGGEGLAKTSVDLGIGALNSKAESSSPENPGGKVDWGGLALGEVKALAEEVVTNSVIEWLVREKLPEVKQELADLQVEIGKTDDLLDQARDEAVDIVDAGSSFRLFTPPSAVAMDALAEAQDAYDAAVATRDSASAVFETAASAAVNTPYPDPWCDSPELLAGFDEIICEAVFPDVDPEPFPGYSQVIRDDIARFCDVVGVIADTFSELTVP